jgi:DNA-binding CsgD family transcriptional regulator
MSDNMLKRFAATLRTSAKEPAGLQSPLEQIIAGGTMGEDPRRSGFDLVELLAAHFGERVDVARTPVDCLPRLPLKGWRVVDEVAVESELYLLLRSTTRPKTGVHSLTEREREAVRLACGGATNKEIAYLMNVSASTVGVLLWRASRRVGAADRDELTGFFEGRAP